MSEFFFEDEDVQDIAQSHIDSILKLEESEAERVMKSYRRVRQSLRDRLDALSANGMDGGTFTEQKLRGSLLQVDLALQEMNRNLSTDMDSSAQKSAEMGIQHLIKEIEKWNKKFTGAVQGISLNVVNVATQAKNFKFNQMESSLNSYSSFVRGQFARTLSDSAIEQASMSEVVSRIGNFFLGEEWRIHRLVRTELHGVYSQGKMHGMLDLWGDGDGEIPDLKKTLYHAIDKRTGKDSIRLAQKNPIVEINEPFIEYSTGKKLIYQAPPNRPNDRAILIPYRDSWSE